MVVLSDELQKLKRFKQELLDEQGRLITLIKTDYPDLYNWIIENSIDLTNLKTYAAGITSAFVIAMSTLTQGNVGEAREKAPPTVALIEVSELQGLTEEAKAQLVWNRYGRLIEFTAQRYNVDPKLIFTTIMIESGGDTYAKRSEPRIGDASYGLGQLLYGTAMGLGFSGTPEELYDPSVNIDLIGRYHRRNLDVYGDNLTAEQLTIAYNAGSPYSFPNPGHIDKFQKWFSRVSGLIG